MEQEKDCCTRSLQTGPGPGSGSGSGPAHDFSVNPDFRNSENRPNSGRN
jgi:hypothetical protein